MLDSPPADATTMWKKRHHLDRMTMRELVVAYFQYYAIQTYLLLALASGALAVVWTRSGGLSAVSAVLAVLAYPLVWYCLHRWVLHSRWMFKSPLTARTWKRIHFDHHQDPNHLEVLFGALHTTLPTIAVATMPIGYALEGWGGAMAALSAGLVTTCFYEFCHCVQHLNYKPRWRFLAEMKARHMTHHFHDESGNFGITNFAWDRLFGTYYEREARPEKSPSVFNLGYTLDEARRYPWVMQLTGSPPMDHPRKPRSD